jgi:hypothetical protein
MFKVIWLMLSRLVCLAYCAMGDLLVEMFEEAGVCSKNEVYLTSLFSVEWFTSG